MHDGIKTAFQSCSDHIRVDQVALDNLDLRIGMRLEIDDAHVRAICAELRHHVPADEARASGYEDTAPTERPRAGPAHVCASALAV